MRLHEILENFAENKITLHTDPNYYGAEVGNYKPTGPVVNISSNQLVGFEPDDKMQQPQSATKVKGIIDAIRKGQKMPPVLVRKHKNGYQVIDGHHRFWSMKKVGMTQIPAQIVPDSDIVVKENFADGKVKGKSRPGRVKRAGASCKGSVTSLRKKARNTSGERAKMYHWCANMKSGRKK